MSLTHAPKQARSKTTEEKLLGALESLLEEAYFDQISIKDIAARAGVAVGTVYRRFRDKDALLPVLYRRYEQDLEVWIAGLWPDEVLERYPEPRQRLHHLVREHVAFYSAHRGMMRTLHLHSRLGGDLADASFGARRRDQYIALLLPVFELAPVPLSANKQRMVILALVSSLCECLLYHDANPARQLSLSTPALVDEMTEMLAAYALA